MSDTSKQCFSADEIDFLLSALDAKETEQNTNDMMSSLMGALLCGNDKEKLNELRAEQEDKREKERSETEARRQQSILLKAKLVTMKIEQQGGEMFRAASAGSGRVQGV